MEDTLITFETAKLAKEKGFDIKTTHYYLGDEEYHILNISKDYGIEGLNWNLRSTRTSAPTQSLLQKWLREKYDNDISIIKEVNKYLFVSYNILISESCYSKYKDLINLDVNYNTYEEALEFALQKGLELINNFIEEG